MQIFLYLYKENRSYVLHRRSCTDSNRFSCFLKLIQQIAKEVFGIRPPKCLLSFFFKGIELIKVFFKTKISFRLTNHKNHKLIVIVVVYTVP